MVFRGGSLVAERLFARRAAASVVAVFEHQIGQDLERKRLVWIGGEFRRACCRPLPRVECGVAPGGTHVFIVSATDLHGRKARNAQISLEEPTAVDYAVMLALIVIVCLTAIQAIGTNPSTTFQNITDQID